MKLITRHHGGIEYSENDIIYFKKGLPGFNNLKKYIYFTIEENNLFGVLHSIEDENIGLTTVSPFNVYKEYEFNLDEETMEALKIKAPDEVVVLTTVTLSSKVENITINLKAPIIININSKLGEQIILDNDKYSVKHPLIQE